MAQTWACPTGEEWDRYVLGAQSAALTEHLEKCPSCRLAVAEKTRDWAELAREWLISATGRIIHLAPLADSRASADTPARLAAKGDEPVAMTEAVTLASPDRDILLRAIRDPYTQEVWLYLVAEKDPARCGHALVRAFGTGVEYVTDAQGRVNLGKVDLPSPTDLKAEVHLPTAVFTFLPLGEMKDKTESIVLVSPGGDQIRVTWAGDKPPRRLEVEVLKLAGRIADAPLKVAVHAAGAIEPPQLVSVTADRASVETGETREKLEIYFYQ